MESGNNKTVQGLNLREILHELFAAAVAVGMEDNEAQYWKTKEEAINKAEKKIGELY